MRFLIILVALTTIFSCSKQKEQIEKFVFDNTQISYKEIHRYEFDKNGKIKTDYTTDLMYIAGVSIDTTTSEKHFEYNDKGQIIRVFDTFDSVRRTRFYNESDSLIADYAINNYNDTTELTVITYLDGKNHKITDRRLILKIPEDINDLTKEGVRNYDTLYHIIELIYDGDQHVKTLLYDKDGAVTEEIKFYYEDGLKTESITYAFVGDNKYVKETTTYSENDTHTPDVVATNIRGDTTFFLKTILQNENKIVISVGSIEQFSMTDISYYDKNGLLTGTILLDPLQNLKTIYSYTYDSRGNLLEQANYKTKIK